jgi:hypothetical protein
VRLTAAGRKLVKKIKSSKGLTVLLKVTLKVPGHKEADHLQAECAVAQEQAQGDGARSQTVS